MNIHEIISELNKSNSSNHKLAVLRENESDEFLQKILKMTYDRVQYVYGITMKNIEYSTGAFKFTLSEALELLEKLSRREFTGNTAKHQLEQVLGSLSIEDADLIKKIITRDLRINIGRTQINKVWKGLITKPSYMRCGVYGEKTKKHISFPALLQLKADGTYREFHVQGGITSSRSRSGESYEYPRIFDTMSTYPDGVYVGELTVFGTADRALANGLINSDNLPHENIMLELWDYITLEEYDQASLRDKKNLCTTQYKDRFSALNNIIKSDDTNVLIIDTAEVHTLQEALEKTSEYMTNGFEGAILKDLTGVFKDGTSKHQLKLKLEIDCEMRIIGFKDGTPGTKREGKIGSIIFENDEGTVKGKCSGFNDKEMEYFTEHKELLLNKIITVQFNDLSRARGNEYYALSHPRFIEIREEKDETDTLEQVRSLREMAIALGD